MYKPYSNIIPITPYNYEGIRYKATFNYKTGDVTIEGIYVEDLINPNNREKLEKLFGKLKKICNQWQYCDQGNCPACREVECYFLNEQPKLYDNKKLKQTINDVKHYDLRKKRVVKNKINR